MKERVTLNRKEQKRAMVLNKVEAGELRAREAAATLRLSLRQVRRLLAAYRGPTRTSGSRWSAYGSSSKHGDTGLRGPHHEIHLSDPRRTAPERLRTVVRHPVEPLGRAQAEGEQGG